MVADDLQKEPNRQFTIDLEEAVALALESKLKEGETLECKIMSILHNATGKKPQQDKKIGIVDSIFGWNGYVEMTEAEFQSIVDANNLSSLILHEITTGSDRATTIVGGAFAEEGLTSLMRACYLGKKLREEKKIEDLFHYSGPFGTFSVKIDVAYLNEIIGPETFEDLHGIREIRNKFAHFITMDKNGTRPEKVAFDHPKIIKICNGLKYSKSQGVEFNGLSFTHGKSARDTYIVTVILVGQALHYAANCVRQGMSKSKLSQFFH